MVLVIGHHDLSDLGNQYAAYLVKNYNKSDEISHYENLSTIEKNLIEYLKFSIRIRAGKYRKIHVIYSPRVFLLFFFFRILFVGSELKLHIRSNTIKNGNIFVFMKTVLLQIFSQILCTKFSAINPSVVILNKIFNFDIVGVKIKSPNSFSIDFQALSKDLEVVEFIYSATISLQRINELKKVINFYRKLHAALQVKSRLNLFLTLRKDLTDADFYNMFGDDEFVRDHINLYFNISDICDLLSNKKSLPVMIIWPDIKYGTVQSLKRFMAASMRIPVLTSYSENKYQPTASYIFTDDGTDAVECCMNMIECLLCEPDVFNNQIDCAYIRAQKYEAIYT